MTRDAYRRFAELLQSSASPQEDGTSAVRRLPYREIATRVGASREMVVRISKSLVDSGYLRVTADAFILVKPLPPVY